MNARVQISVTGLALILWGTGCAVVSGPVKLGMDGAVNLDNMARHVADDYRKRCYEPVAKLKVPDDICQFQLFERAERQWGANFTAEDLKRTGNRILGDEIEKELLKLLVYDNPSQRFVNSNTRTRFEIIDGLKDKYKLR